MLAPGADGIAESASQARAPYEVRHVWGAPGDAMEGDAVKGALSVRSYF